MKEGGCEANWLKGRNGSGEIEGNTTQKKRLGERVVRRREQFPSHGRT